MSEAASPELESLVQAFRALPPRSAQLLVRRHLQGSSLEACAAHAGISVTACAVHLARAADELGTRLGVEGFPAPEPRDHAEEEHAALSLEAALEAPPSTRNGDARVRVLRALRAHGPALAAALREAELAAERSPERAREDLLRRVAIALLVAVALFFAWKRGAL